MKFQKLIGTTTRTMHAIIRVLTWVGAGMLVLMMLLIVAHITGRYLFGYPLPGTIEIVALMMVPTVFFVIAYTEVRRGHVKVDLVFERFPRRAQTIARRITYFIGGVFFIAMAWECWGQMQNYLYPLVRATVYHSIPFAPFWLVMIIGSLLLALEMLLNCFHPLPPEAGEVGGHK